MQRDVQHPIGARRGMEGPIGLDQDGMNPGLEADAPSPRLSFTDGRVGRHLWRLSSFMALGSLSLNVAQIGETVFLGILGTEALAAMGFAFPVTITLFAFAGGIGTGASSVTARAFGAGDRERSALLVTHAQILGVAIGIVLGALAIVFAADILALLGARGEVHRLATEYLSVYMLGFPSFMFAIVASALLRATGSAASPGIVMSVGSLMQLAIAPLLIFGLFGLPELGMVGAAWSFVISRTISTVLYFAMLQRGQLLRAKLHGMMDSWRAIMHVGAPAIASGLVMPAGMMIITRLLAGHGNAVVAGYNVAMRVETIAHMILWSATSSAEPLIGQNWGARMFDSVRRALSLTHRFSLGWGVVTFVVMVLIGETVVAMIDDNPQVVDVAVAFFFIIPLSIGFMGMTQTACACFNALGKPTPSFVISLLRALVVYVPLAWLGNWWMGYVGIFIATALTNVLVGLLAWRWNWNYVRSAIDVETSSKAADNTA